MSLFGLIDWLLLSQAFEGGHFKKLKFVFPIGSTPATPRRLAIDFRQTPPPFAVLVGAVGASRQFLTSFRSAAALGRPWRTYFGRGEATSFWKRGSLRSGSNIGSSRSNAGVSGGFAARGASYGIESSLVKVEMERSCSPMRAATRARMSSGLGPVSASLSIGIML